MLPATLDWPGRSKIRILTKRCGAERNEPGMSSAATLADSDTDEWPTSPGGSKRLCARLRTLAGNDCRNPIRQGIGNRAGLLNRSHVPGAPDNAKHRRGAQTQHRLVLLDWRPGVLIRAQQQERHADMCQHGRCLGAIQEGLDLRRKLLRCRALDHRREPLQTRSAIAEIDEKPRKPKMLTRASPAMREAMAAHISSSHSSPASRATAGRPVALSLIRCSLSAQCRHRTPAGGRRRAIYTTRIIVPLQSKMTRVRAPLTIGRSKCVHRSMPITDSGASRSLIPVEADHRFRSKPIAERIAR